MITDVAGRCIMVNEASGSSTWARFASCDSLAASRAIGAGTDGRLVSPVERNDFVFFEGLVLASPALYRRGGAWHRHSAAIAGR
jgi:hypothetical protein